MLGKAILPYFEPAHNEQPNITQFSYPLIDNRIIYSGYSRIGKGRSQEAALAGRVN